MEWRYLAQRTLTGEWLHRDLPLVTTGPVWGLSGGDQLQATISPEWRNEVGSDGLPILAEWGTTIYAEADGQIRWGGLLKRCSFTGATLTLEAVGFAGYAEGMPYTGPLYSKVNLDPTEAFAAIWTHLQTQPDGNLGLTVVRPTDCPIRIGVPAVAEVREVLVGTVAWGKTWQIKSNVDPRLILGKAKGNLAQPMNNASDTVVLRKLDTFDRPPIPYVIHIGSEDCRVTARNGLTLTVVRGYGSTTASAHGNNAVVTFDDVTQERVKVAAVPAEPYVLAWWEAPDCGQELAALANETPFDFREEHKWNGEDVTHRLIIDYPRLGQKRTDLAFIQGVNITQVVTVDRDGSEFAQTVMGLGKGEGVKTVRGEVAVRDGRVRRVAVYTDKMAATTARITALARTEHDLRKLVPVISSITVRNHPDARIGSWTVGDDILVQATLPYLGDIQIWCRVLSWQLAGEDSAVLTLARSDTFRYGPTGATS